MPLLKWMTLWLVHDYHTQGFYGENLGQNDKSVNGVNYTSVSCQKSLKDRAQYKTEKSWNCYYLWLMLILQIAFKV